MDSPHSKAEQARLLLEEILDDNQRLNLEVSGLRREMQEAIGRNLKLCNEMAEMRERLDRLLNNGNGGQNVLVRAASL